VLFGYSEETAKSRPLQLTDSTIVGRQHQASMRQRDLGFL